MAKNTFAEAKSTTRKILQTQKENHLMVSKSLYLSIIMDGIDQKKTDNPVMAGHTKDDPPYAEDYWSASAWHQKLLFHC